MDLDELVAREQIRDLVARYNHAGDRGRLDDLVACFAARGVLEIEGEAPLRGRQAIRAALEKVVERLAAATERPTLRHHVSSLRIERTAPDAARAWSCFAVFTEIGLDHWGRYVDELVREEDTWHFARRRVRVDGAAPGSRMVVGGGRG